MLRDVPLKFLGIGLLLVIHAVQSSQYTNESRSISPTPPPPENAKINVSISRSDLFSCCPHGDRLIDGECVPANATVRLPPLYSSDDLTLIDETPDPLEYFQLIVQRPDCENGVYDRLQPSYNFEHAFKLLDNSTIYMYRINDTFDNDLYCINGVNDTGISDVTLCFVPQDVLAISKTYGLYISIPFLFATFFVYSVLPELKNLHGLTLRGYIGSLVVAYTVLATMQTIPPDDVPDQSCYALAYITHFSFVASFFWLNVMCFDIWWTFGGFRALHGSVNQRERKKFLIYSIYAWGCASLLTGVCAVMDLVPGIPDHLYKPQFGEQTCWFASNEAMAIYFYGPVAVTILCNILLFASTALKIMQHKKDTSLHLGGADSRRHDDNKQRFNLYLKLFIVMGINWSMEIISFAFTWAGITAWIDYLWYISDFTNALQGVIIFIIFVWKEKIRQLLLRRFNCYGSNVLSRNSTRSAYHSSAASRTCTTSTAMS